jgi:hypothetical protein
MIHFNLYTNFLHEADYAAIQKSVKDDVVMIEKRKRMLQTFLNRILSHSRLGAEHVFHRFLESGVSWVNEVLWSNASIGLTY